VWRSNPCLIAMHNKGSPNVMKNVHASILTDVTNMSWQTSTCHPMQNGHITLVLKTLYWIWIDCTISIPYENFHSCDFTKNYMWMRFFIQKNITIFTKKKNCWKFTFIWKRKRIMLEAFVSKSIPHVYQNIRWNLKELTPNSTKCTKKNSFCIKWLPHSVFSPLWKWNL
jgi:hypothetical protein